MSKAIMLPREQAASQRTFAARAKQRFGRAATYILLTAASLVMLTPFFWMLSTSLKSSEFVLSIPPQLIPQSVTLDSYERLTHLFPMRRMFFNSALVATVATVGQLTTASLAAYAFARMRFRGRDALFLLYLATLMVPFQVTIIPLFILMRFLGWINTYQGLIAPGLFSAFGIFLLRQYFLTIPVELEEAAFIDGASRLTVLRQVILPLSKPALATFAVFSFMGNWNAFLWPLFVVNDPDLMTLPVGLATLHGRWLTEWNLVMAGSVITVLPMIILFLIAQRYFVRGVVLSGLRG